MRRFGVRRLALFGSHVRNEADPQSDIDFVVDLERKTFDDYMGLKEFLEAIFHRSVDLVMEGTIKPALRPIIMKELMDVPNL